MSRLTMKVYAGLLFAAVLSAPALAPRAQEPAARKVDEFAKVGGCDHGARLDNFAVELMNDPGAAGYVVAYGPAGKGHGTADFRLNVTRDYLVNMRGLDPSRLHAINGGRYKTMDESFAELWLVPPGAAAPSPATFTNDSEVFKGKFSEYEAWDGFEWGEETGPPVGDSTLAGFAEVLRSQPDLRAYVVVSHGEESAPGAWRRVTEPVSAALDRHGIASGRVRVIFAGYDKKLTVQLWALPKDAPPPAADAGPERRPTLAAQVGSMGDYQLGHADEARSLFRGFAEVLKVDETLTAHIFVRLPSPREDDGEPTEPDPKVPPPADVQQLAESWREALRKEYGVAGRRLVVQVLPPEGEWSEGRIEVWVVPPGAAPPDPFAAPEGEHAEETAGEPRGISTQF